MNKIEQQLFEEFDRFEKFSQYISKVDAARLGAKIALELAEKAFYVGSRDPEVEDTVTFDQFKQEVL